ncbi:hypothetical protein EON63_07980 [archaeon]|nr:MAG: hypothetical protein EON63_07980 [archaeon]
MSNFCNMDGKGQVCSNPSAEDCGCVTVDATNPLDFPPYSIANHQDTGRLGARTLPPSSAHYNNVTMYNTHNLYGLTEQMATYNALYAIRNQQRPFVLSRSSFVSTGVHSAKWTGDNGEYIWERCICVCSCIVCMYVCMCMQCMCMCAEHVYGTVGSSTHTPCVTPQLI